MQRIGTKKERQDTIILLGRSMGLT